MGSVTWVGLAERWREGGAIMQTTRLVLLLALSGFRYDLAGAPEAAPNVRADKTSRASDQETLSMNATAPPSPLRYISFDPKINAGDFSTFFSTGRCWGIYRQKKNEAGELAQNVEVLYGSLGDTILADPQSIQRKQQ